jgi:4'-phosphopantetheinyl transferase
VGCDLEVVEPRSTQFVADWFTPLERDVVYRSGEPDLYANLVWSAKESALKVLRTGLRRDTRSVEVRLLADERDGWNRMEVHSVEGGAFTGWWRRAGAFVFTYAASRSTTPPAALDRPDPLDSAVPSHSWMDEPLRGSPATHP